MISEIQRYTNEYFYYKGWDRAWEGGGIFDQYAHIFTPYFVSLAFERDYRFRFDVLEAQRRIDEYGWEGSGGIRRYEQGMYQRMKSDMIYRAEIGVINPKVMADKYSI
jgi:hypothetical protein